MGEAEAQPLNCQEGSDGEQLLDQETKEIIIPARKRQLTINKKDYMSSGGDDHFDYAMSD